MKKLLFFLLLMFGLTAFAQEKTKDYWIYIKAEDEITTILVIQKPGA